ncbi:unnamed protein product [Gadus morhua 'NCC']
MASSLSAAWRPSLARANKCVFCWRHHTNPMCPEWRWKMDPAEEILQVALGHPQSRIRHFRASVRSRCPLRHCDPRGGACQAEAPKWEGSSRGEPEQYEEGLAGRALRPLPGGRANHVLFHSFPVTNAQFPKKILWERH